MNRPFRQQVELITSLVKRDLKSRYKDSVLGFVWSLFRPAFLTLVIWVVFSVINQHMFEDPTIPAGVPYWLRVLVSVLTWNYFIGALADATNSLTANANLLKKVKLDAEVFPIASIASNAVHFLLALLVVMCVLPFKGIGFHYPILLLPVIFALETLLILGISLYLSALNVFYRDIGSFLELISLAWFYVTPVIYSVGIAYTTISLKLGHMWFRLYMFNPAAPILVAMRRVILYGTEGGELFDDSIFRYMVASLVSGLIMTLSGWWLFRKMSTRFADEL